MYQVKLEENKELKGAKETAMYAELVLNLNYEDPSFEEALKHMEARIKATRILIEEIKGKTNG